MTDHDANQEPDVDPRYDLTASELAVRAAQVDRRSEDEEFDYANLVHALGAADEDTSTPPTVEDVLDGIPGAFERAQEAREQARRGEVVPLDELDAELPGPGR